MTDEKQPESSTPAERIRGAEGSKHEPEQKLWHGGYSGKAMIGSWIIGIILTVVLGVVCFALLGLTIGISGMIFGVGAGLIWIYLLGVFAYRKMSVDYELTSQRFIHKSGILTRATDRIEVIDMDDVTYVQGLVQRMMGVGTIRISSSDRSHPELKLIGIDDVQRVADLIDETRRSERRKRGLHIEAI